MARTKVSIHHWFPTEFDRKLPSQWHIRFRDPGPPFKLLVFFDNPLSIREELRVEERAFANPKWFTFKGKIEPGRSGNPTDKDVFVEEVELDVPAEITEDTAKILRVEFEGKKLRGTFVVNRDLKQAFVQEAGHRQDKRKKKKKARRYETTDITILASPDGPLMIEVDGDPDDHEFSELIRRALPGVEFDVLEAVYRVRYDNNDTFFRTAAAAREFAKGFQGASVSRLNRLPPGRALRERVHGIRGKVFAVRGGKYVPLNPQQIADARKLRGVGRFALVFEDRSARVAGPGRMEAIEAGKAAGKGQFLVAREIAMGVYRAGQGVFESMTLPDALDAAAEFVGPGAKAIELVDAAESFAIAATIPLDQAMERLGRRLESGTDPQSGRHAHPHARDGIHSHQGLPAGGGHAHTDSNIGGAHRHRPEDPLGGHHLGLGQGPHDHLLAKGLEDYIRWSIAAHHPRHLWLPGHVRTWIRHVRPGPEEKEFREATPGDWRDHTVWWLHSTGRADASAHAIFFLDPERRIVVKEYEFKDGSRRSPTAADFVAEERWFRDNTPRDLRQRLAESAVFTDRYQALGIPYPDPKTVCLGPCEGTGWVPVFVNLPEMDDDGLRLEDEPDPVFRALWDAADARKPTDDGWHFVACPECEGTGKRVVEFQKDDFKPEESTEAQLGDDWRLMAAKFLTMLEGGKTEFDTVAELVRFAGTLVQEILIRGKLTFRPAEANPRTTELLRRALGRIVTGGVILKGQSGMLIAEGKISATIRGLPLDDLKEFRILIEGDQALGYVRHGEPRGIDLEEFAKTRPLHQVSDENRERVLSGFSTFLLYPVREFVPFEKPRKIDLLEGAEDSIKKVVFKEAGVDDHVSSLSNLELIALHGRLHTLWNHHGGGIPKQEVLDRHIKVLSELRRRGLEHRPKDTLDRETADRAGPDVQLADVAKMLTSPLVLKKPFLAVVGGVSVSGHGNDLDIWINWPTLDDDFARILMFRIKSMLPPDVNVQFLSDPAGPFTSFMPLGDLEVRFVPREKRDVIQMSEQLTAKAEAEAKRSAELDAVVPFRFVFPPKPAAGVRGDEPRRPQTLAGRIKDEDYPVVVQPKFDDVRLKLDKRGDRIALFKEGGQAVDLKLIPTLVAELRKLPGDFVQDTGAQIFIRGKPLGRSEVAGYLNGKTFDTEKDKNLRLTAHDLLYYQDNDVHKRPTAETLKILDQFPRTAHYKVAPWTLSRTARELLAAIRRFRRFPGSEGVVVKVARKGYSLAGGVDRNWWKFRNEADVLARVVAKIPVKGARAWNYLAAIPDAKGNLVPIGKTFNTALDAKIGDTLRVSIGNLNRHKDPATGRIWYAWVFPRVIEIVDDKPDDTKAADAIVKSTSGEVNDAPFPKDFEDIIESLDEQAKSCMTRAEGMAVRKRRPDSYPEGFYRIFHHYRSKSVHKDFRFVAEKGGFLLGWTMTDQPAGEIKKDVDTVDEGYRVQRILNWKFRPDMDPNTKVVSVPKARQPLLWMNALNIFIEEGRVGATADGPGVFTVCDEGTVYRGVDKPDFKEFFFDGKIFKGRTGFRLIPTAGFARNGDREPPKQALQWQVSTNLKDQTPNILGSTERRRPRDQQWVPPEGFMAIPPRPAPRVPVHAGLIKKEHQWWEKGLRPAKRLDRLRDAFNDLVDRGILRARKLESPFAEIFRKDLEAMGLGHQEETRRFLLRRFFFKGATVVRGLPRFWFSLIWRQGGKVKEIRFEDQVNPLRRIEENMFVSATRQDIPSKEAPPGSRDPVDWFQFPEDKEIPSAHPLNPNKRIPVFVEMIDEGELTTFADTDLVLTFRAKGKKLKGNFIVRRPKAKDVIWEFGRSRLPGERRMEVAHGESSPTEKTASQG